MSTPVSQTAATQAAAQATAQANQAAKQAAQSLISGVTGQTLDVDSLVSALVNAQIAGPSAALQAQDTTDKAELSAFGLLSADMLGLQTALAPFTSGSALASFSASLSGQGITAKTGQGALAGTFQIDTTQVAQSQILSSGAFSSADAAAMGSGTLTVSLGGGSSAKSFQVSVNSSNDSLQDIANAINHASGNPGVTATVVTGTNGSSISVQSTATGSDNTISIGVTGATSGSALSQLAVTSAPGSNGGPSSITAGSTEWTQTQAAQDALLSVNGTTPVDSPTNTIQGVLPGITLTLDPTNSNTIGKQTLTITPDASSVESDLSAFVTAYNAVIDELNSLAAPNAGGGGGLLLGDEMINQIGDALGSIAGSAVSNAGLKGTLGSLGITFQSDTGGEPFAELEIDADPNGPTLDSAVTSDPALVSALFNDTNGIAQQLDTVLTGYTASNGLIANRNDALIADIDSIVKQQDDLNDFAMQLTSSFNDQFTALNTVMAQSESDLNFLTALFGGSNSNGALEQSSSGK